MVHRKIHPFSSIMPQGLQKSTLWLFNIAMENHHFLIFLIGKPSISMGHLYHGYVTNNQRVKHILERSPQCSWISQGFYRKITISEPGRLSPKFPMDSPSWWLFSMTFLIGLDFVGEIYRKPWGILIYIF